MIFSKLYISLVAGLREYALDSDAKGLDIDSILDDVYGALSVEDGRLVQLLYNYYDCENLAAAMRGRSNFNPLGRLTREQIDRVTSGGDISDEGWFPQSVVEVIESYDGGRSTTKVESVDGSKSFECALFGAYYEACEGVSNRFMKRWSESDRNLRNVAAALSARVAGRAIDDVVVGRGDVVDQLVRSSAVDFGLRGELSYLDTVITAVSDEQNILEKEHKIDLVRWEIAEELAEGEYFTLDVVLSYLVRVNIVARWRVLDAKIGREMFERLMSGLSGKELINNK
ncbi:MAG: DUF2764 family protein [Rikenellaceae bacterium]